MPGNPFAIGKPARKVVAETGGRTIAKARKLVPPVPAFRPDRAIAGLTDLPKGPHVVLPWPPRQLSPNARIHHAKKAPYVKAYRHECWALALEAFGAGAKFLPSEGPIAVRIDLFPPDGRARDDDNCESAFKPGRDGVAEALRIDDKRFVVTRRLRPEVRGCVIMTFTGELT